MTFPALLAFGLPPVQANTTNTIALCPGYLGGTLAQWRDLQGQGRRSLLLVPVAAGGGWLGAVLLERSGEALFNVLVPVLLLFGSLCIVGQDWLKGLLSDSDGARRYAASWLLLPLGLVAIYGGYFNAGLGVLVLALLCIGISDTLLRLNALKQLLSLAISVAAAAWFMTSGEVRWPVVLVMAAGSLLGGALGGRLAPHVPPRVFRIAVAAVGVLPAVGYLLR